jgi:hypothetical protein
MFPLLATALAAAILPAAALAGTATATVSASTDKKTIQPECTPVPLDTFIATGDYGFHQDLKRGSGNLEVAHENYEFDRRIPLSLSWPGVQCGEWFLRLGADYERFDYTIHNETRLPDTLQSASGIIALDYMVNDETAFMIETRPGVYFEQKVNSGTFDAPTNIALAYPVFGGDKFYVIAGVTVSILSEYPVLPIGGILWHINDQWDLRAYVPDPRLVYEVSDHFELWAGGELVGGAYKTDNRDVSPVKLSGATVTYDEVRTGGGFTWKARPLTIDFGAGYTVYSEFDYNRAGLSFETHPAPYIRLTARLDF